jgi:hypothetical protein
MAFKGFGGIATVGGIEEYISMTITGEMTELIVDPASMNSVPSYTSYYNPRYNVSIEGISSGVSVAASFTVGGKTYVKTSDVYTKTVGDVVKVSISGVHNPSSTLL